MGFLDIFRKKQQIYTSQNMELEYTHQTLNVRFIKKYYIKDDVWLKCEVNCNIAIINAYPSFKVQTKVEGISEFQSFSEEFNQNNISNINLGISFKEIGKMKQVTLFPCNVTIEDSHGQKAIAMLHIDFAQMIHELKTKESISSIPKNIEIAFGRSKTTNNPVIIAKLSPKLAIASFAFNEYKIEFEENIIQKIEKGGHEIAEIELIVLDERKIKQLKKNIIANIFFNTELQIIYYQITIPHHELKKAFLTLKDTSSLTEEDLVLVHVDKKEFASRVIEKKILGPYVMYGSPNRPSVHFTLNHVVRSHGRGSWEDANITYITSYKETIELNKNEIAGGTSVDTFFIGYVKFPRSLIVVERLHGESWETYTSRINEILIEQGFKVMSGGDYNWANMNVQEEEKIMKDITKNSWFTYAPHTYSEFGIPESRLERTKYINEQEDRKNYLKFLKELFPDAFERFKKQLRAWDTFWTKKGL